MKTTGFGWAYLVLVHGVKGAKSFCGRASSLSYCKFLLGCSTEQKKNVNEAVIDDMWLSIAHDAALLLWSVVINRLHTLA